MEADRFEALTRSLTAARSRRGVVTTVLGGVIGLLGLTETAAKKKKRKKGKKGKKDEQPPPTTAAPSAPVCPVERQCPSGCCPEGQVCRDSTECCTENVAERCTTADVHCGEIGGLCGWPINCGSCPPNNYCRDGGCTCRQVGQACGPDAGGETCCSGQCGQGFFGEWYCRTATCDPPGGACVAHTDCCTLICDTDDLLGTNRCIG